MVGLNKLLAGALLGLAMLFAVTTFFYSPSYLLTAVMVLEFLGAWIVLVLLICSFPQKTIDIRKRTIY